MLNALKAQPEDKIIRLIKEFKEDGRQGKIDLGVGVYRDSTGATPIMSAVKRAEKVLWERETTKTYTQIAGDAEFREAIVSLTLAEHAPSGRVATIHTPGGTGAVRQAFELTHLAAPDACVWISDPSWPNHFSMAKHVGLTTRQYRYFDPETRSVDFAGMMQDVGKANAGDIFVLHGCCHNPTGANLDHGQWQDLAEQITAKGIVPLVDIAYQGFGDGIEPDARGLRSLATSLPEMLIAVSCSKNFSIYRERAGVLIAISESSRASQSVQTTLAHLNRQNYSFPPDHGARLVTMILNDEDGLRQEWMQELEALRTSMLGLREHLAAELRQLTGSDRFGFLASHRGMFSLLGASEAQVMEMRKNAAIYMVSDGRINVAGLNDTSVPVLARAMVDAGL